MNIKLNWEPILSKALINKENQLNCNTEAVLKTQTTGTGRRVHRGCTTDNMNTSNAQARPVAKSSRCSRNTELQRRWLPAQIFLFMVG